MNWVSILGKVSIWIILIPLVIGLAGYKKLNKDSRLILFIVSIGTIPQVLNPFLKDSSWLTFAYNLYTPIEFFTYWYLFNSQIQTIFLKKTYKAILILFILISLYFLFDKNLFSEFLYVWVVVNNVFQLIIILLCLFNFYLLDTNDFTKTQPLFWFIIGIIMYASCTALFYSLWSYLKSDKNPVLSNLKVLHHIFNILIYIFFSYGLFLNFYKDKYELKNV